MSSIIESQVDRPKKQAWQKILFDILICLIGKLFYVMYVTHPYQKCRGQWKQSSAVLLLCHVTK